MATTTSSGKLTQTLKNMFLAGLLVTTSIAGTLFLQDRMQLNATNVPSENNPLTTPAPQPLFTSLEPFTVSLRDDHGQRVLYVGITLRVNDDASQQILNDYMPEVRDRVLSTLTSQSTAQIQAPGGRESLAAQLKSTLAQPYTPHTHGPGIHRVLFTAYVVQ